VEDKVIHATLTLGELVLAGADVLPSGYEPPSGFAVLLAMETAQQAERVFTALAVNGTVRVPLQQTFWSAAFGIVVDQFGVPWEINCEEAATT